MSPPTPRFLLKESKTSERARSFCVDDFRCVDDFVQWQTGPNKIPFRGPGMVQYSTGNM